MVTPPNTILLVDDEGSFRETIKMALEAWGYGVCVAEDGEQALAITKTEGPRVVLSDVIMPKLDGLGLLRLLKEWNPNIAVILFTAHPSIEDAVSAIKEGAEDMLTKPIDFKRLRQDLERLFGGGDRSPGGASPRLDPASSGSTSASSRPRRKYHLRLQDKVHIARWGRSPV